MQKLGEYCSIISFAVLALNTETFFKMFCYRASDYLHPRWSRIYPESCLLHSKCISYAGKFELQIGISVVPCFIIMNCLHCNYTHMVSVMGTNFLF